MKTNELETYELGQVPAALVEQIAAHVVNLIKEGREADDLDDFAMMPLGVPLELQATRLVLFSLANRAGFDVHAALDKARDLITASLNAGASGMTLQ